MTIYTDDEAREQLGTILSAARSQGEVRIRTKDGQEYELRPVAATASAFDVRGIDLQMTAEEIVGFVRESREN